ncbi:MAG: UbiA family prenyltransferase, partial [Chloroflexota bacterium]|nr:UbiA family prenyltransferase [Chloroflexota bacterium]
MLVALAFALLFAPQRTAESRRRLWRLGAMMAAQQGAISLHNDWCDRHLDATAKPWRAIPRGLAPASAVRVAAWVLGAVSIVPAWPIGTRLVVLDVIGLGAGFLYNARLKRTRWSWLPFATAFPLLPLFGATALGAWPRLWWSLFLVGAPAVLAIHLADTIPDLEGDAGSGVQGLAHRLGAPRARRVCLGALAGA